MTILSEYGDAQCPVQEAHGSHPWRAGPAGWRQCSGRSEPEPDSAALSREPCPRQDEHAEHPWAKSAREPRLCPGLREIPLTARNEPYPHAQCGHLGMHDPHGWRPAGAESPRWCRGTPGGSGAQPYEDGAGDILSLEIELTPQRLAEMIDLHCTPDFKVTLVRALFEADRALAAELFHGGLG